MNNYEKDYKDLLRKITYHGEIKKNRTDSDAITGFNESLTIDVTKGFPINTSKKIFFDKGYHEYVWFIQGMHTIKYLNDNGIKWWNEYADAKGNLGKVYGYQLRNFNGEVDQLSYVIEQIKSNTRRAHITLWNPCQLKEMSIPPCYTDFTFVRINNKLNMTMHMRSSDVFLGLPYDIIIGTLFLMDMAEFCELEPNLLGMQLDEPHVYMNHKEAVHEYLIRPIHDLPKLDKNRSKLIDYKHEKFIKAKMNN